MAVLGRNNYIIKEIEVGKNLNIRQKINNLGADPGLVLLEKYDIVSEFGNLTDLGRRIQADRIFRGEDGTVEGLVAAVKAVEEAEKPTE